MTQDPGDQQLLEIALAVGSAGRHKADLKEAGLDAREFAKPAAEGLETLSADLLGIDDPVHMYLREIGRVALLTAEEEVVLAKAIELGEQLVEAPWKGMVSLREWTTHDTESKTRTAKTQHRTSSGKGERSEANLERIERRDRACGAKRSGRGSPGDQSSWGSSSGATHNVTSWPKSSHSCSR